MKARPVRTRHAIRRGGTVLPLLIALAAPSPAEAVEVPCTDAYFICLNSAIDAGMRYGWVFETLGSIECAAGWTGCILELI